MYKINFVILILLSSLFSKENISAEWLTSIIYARDSILERFWGGER